MRFRLIDKPQYAPMAQYLSAIEKICEKARNIDGILSVYQIGSVSNPGISDIDLIMVFEDDRIHKSDLLNGFKKSEKYLFIHGLFGTSAHLFKESQHFTFYHNLKLLMGIDLLPNIPRSNPDTETVLKRQIAMEYLIKLYYTLNVQAVYGIIKVRSLLLELKAAYYDLNFLEIHQGVFFDLLIEIIELRKIWFAAERTDAQLSELVKQILVELPLFLAQQLLEGDFYVINPKMKVTNNIELIPGTKMAIEHQGITFPNLLYWLGKKYFNIQNKLNKFSVFIPFCENGAVPAIIVAREQFTKTIVKYNKANLPHFSPLISGFTCR